MYVHMCVYRRKYVINKSLKNEVKLKSNQILAKWECE